MIRGPLQRVRPVRRRGPGLFCAIVLSAGLLAGLDLAHAQSRPDARQMTCDEVQRMIKERGEVVMTTGQFTFERFVEHNGYCQFDERVRQRIIATSDTGTCPVRFVCERRLDLFGRF